MQEMQRLGKNILNSLLIILIGLIFISLLSYFNIIRGSFISICELLIIFVAIFRASYKQGKCGDKKGFIEVIKISLIFVVLLITLNLMLYNTFTIKNWFYYGLILFVSIVGGLFGVSRRIEEKK